MWQTTLPVNTNNATMEIDKIKIKSRIVKGDSLSPRLLRQVYLKLIAKLNETNKPYQTSKHHTPINHVLHI